MKKTDIHFVPDKDRPKPEPVTVRDKLVKALKVHNPERQADAILEAIREAVAESKSRG